MAGSFPVVVISGARQVGKTTLVRHLFPEFDYFQFDPAVDIEAARYDPDLFLLNHLAPLILDEIQYAPEVVSAIKRRIDPLNLKSGQYLITGSQQWQVMKSLSESLAGRAVFLDLEGFSLQEIAGHGSRKGWLETWLETPDEVVRTRTNASNSSTAALWEWLWRGFLPGVQDLHFDLVDGFWDGYQRTYVERDARLGGDVDDWQQFGLFMRLVGALTAQEINYSQLGREIGLTSPTAKRWLQILEGTYQWMHLPAFTGNLIKRVSSKPKGYISDTGLACHLSQLSSPKALGGHPMTGALFETAMVHEIRKQNSRLQGSAAFYHWRSAGGAEVDLILERDGVLYPFEIKVTSRPGKTDASGINAFRTSYPHLQIGKGAILCATERSFWVTSDVAAIPWNRI